MASVEIKVEDAVYEELERNAAPLGMTVDQHLSMLLEQYLAAEEERMLQGPSAHQRAGATPANEG